MYKPGRPDGRSPRYERLKRVWFDTTRNYWFYRIDQEDHLTATLWENLSLFHPSESIPALTALCQRVSQRECCSSPNVPAALAEFLGGVFKYGGMFEHGGDHSSATATSATFGERGGELAEFIDRRRYDRSMSDVQPPDREVQGRRERHPEQIRQKQRAPDP